ncbi:MAG: hypothetical protein ABIS03_07820, partial [Gemmatimonadaceae bacterium]
MRTILVRVFAAIAIVILILVIGVFALTNTDWGHKQVQKRVVGSIQNSSHGIIRVGSVTGNLLKGFTLHKLVITDSTGAPFVKADEASARYAIRTLTGSRVDFDEVRLVRPVIVLDRKPGGIWNYDRIFPRHSATETGVQKTGWGTYVRFTNVTLVDGDITVRSPWEPKASLPPVKRQAAMDLALGPDGRFLIGKVSNGYQKISKFHHVDAKLPLVRLEDPDNPTRRADVASLSMIAEPFKPPAVRVKSLAGRFDFTSDSVWFKNISATLPGSELTATGRYTVATNNLTLRSHANRIAASDLRWVEPRLPERGSGKLDFALDWVGDTSVYKAHNADLTIGDAHLAGELGMTVLGEDISFQDTDLRFADLDTRLIEQVFPTLKSPRSGILTGRAKVDGDRNDLAVDGDFTFDDRKAGRNRVVAVGNVGFPGGAFRADNLRLRLEPVQVELARTFVPTLPIGGTITGTATVDGSTESRMTARADITHVDRGSVSRITGNATIRGSAGATMASSWFDLDARVHPLSLVTVGRFAPTAGLRGTAEGPIHLTGTMRNLAVRSQLGFSDGGSVGVIGRFDLASREISYNADVTAHLFNANTILARAPKTSLNATASA